MTTPLLSVRDLQVSYSTKRGPVEAVQGVSFEVYPGEVTAIVGESGSGKTTSAMAAIGLLPANATVDAGTIDFEGRDVSRLQRKQWRELRGKRIGLIPQDPNNSLNPLKTIGASVEEGMRIHKAVPAESAHARAVELLEQVGIDDPQRRYHQYPHELSGGMKQRVLIAAALALEPQVLIADEPTSALDVTVQKVILDVLDEMRERLGIGILLITHDLAVAGDRADRVVVMESGRVRESGVAAGVLSNPTHPYTRRLLADAPSLSAAPSRPARGGREDFVAVSGLGISFGDFRAVDDISFRVAAGTTHALVGESGSGKTTTGRAIAMFNQPTEGEIRVDGQPVTGIRESERRARRSEIQLVYQNPFGSLDPRQSIGETIAEPLRNLRGAGKKEARDKAREFMELVSLEPGMFDRRPRELSGGQRQRVAIARAMIVEPKLVVLDEAVSALDVTVQAQILRLLQDLQERLGLTYIFISHDLAVVNQIADTVSVLSHGRQVESGSTRDVFDNPQSPFTRQLLSAIPGSHYRAGDLNLGL